MLLGELHGYEFHVPTTGGKAGKGQNLTSTIQVRKAGFIAKQFRFTLTNSDSRMIAIARAKKWARENATVVL